MTWQSQAFALLETWTCYGQWSPDDSRGYVSNTLTAEGYRPKRNAPGTPFDRDEKATYQRAKELQKYETVSLTTELAHIAAIAIVEASMERDWHVLRGAIMSNHVHILVSNCPDDGPMVRRILKGVSQAALSAHVGKSQKWWTRGGSDRYKHGDAAIETALRYVANQERQLIAVADNNIILL